MFNTDERDQHRRLFELAWQKHQRGEILTPLESQLVAVIIDHPEYHPFFEKVTEEQCEILGQPDSQNQENPYFHLGLHLSIRDQVHLDSPRGIRAIFQAYAQRYGSALEAEHQMIAVFLPFLWEFIETGQSPDLRAYLESLKNKF